MSYAPSNRRRASETTNAGEYVLTVPPHTSAVGPRRDRRCSRKATHRYQRRSCSASTIRSNGYDVGSALKLSSCACRLRLVCVLGGLRFSIPGARLDCVLGHAEAAFVQACGDRSTAPQLPGWWPFRTNGVPRHNLAARRGPSRTAARGAASPTLCSAGRPFRTRRGPGHHRSACRCPRCRGGRAAALRAGCRWRWPFRTARARRNNPCAPRRRARPETRIARCREIAASPAAGVGGCIGAFSTCLAIATVRARSCSISSPQAGRVPWRSAGPRAGRAPRPHGLPANLVKNSSRNRGSVESSMVSQMASSADAAGVCGPAHGAGGEAAGRR